MWGIRVDYVGSAALGLNVRVCREIFHRVILCVAARPRVRLNSSPLNFPGSGQDAEVITETHTKFRASCVKGKKTGCG
jgi:hypothetical protein